MTLCREKICLFIHCWMLLLVREMLVGGQVITVTSTEGICSCPHILYTFTIYSDNVARCETDSAHYAPPNGQRSSYLPKLFGVQITNSKHDKKRSLKQESSVTLTSSYETVAVNSPTVLASANERTSSYITETTSGATSKISTTVNAKAITSTASTQATTTQITSTNSNATTSHVARTTTDPTSPMTSSTNNATANLSSGTTHYVTTAEVGNSTGPIPPFIQAQLLQVYDLDREKADKHFVTVNCFNDNDTNVGNAIFYIVVNDINDNSPIFNTESLQSTVPTSVSFGEAVMLLKATDADIGLNAKLRFGKVRGTERLKYKNATDTVRASGSYFYVHPSGYVMLLDSITRDVTVTFKVTVKDRGSKNDGNRATATATVLVYASEPQPHTTPAPVLPPDIVSWWVITVPCIAGVIILAFTAFVSKKCINRRQHGPVLVIDDDTLLDDGGAFGGIAGDNIDSRTESSHVWFEERSDSDTQDDLLGSNRLHRMPT